MGKVLCLTRKRTLFPILSRLTEEQSQQLISYTVFRKRPKKRNNLFKEEIPTEVIHHYPDNLDCDDFRNNDRATLCMKTKPFL